MSNPIASWMRRRREEVESRILTLLGSDPGGAQFGYDMMRTLGLGSGRLYPALDRLENAGMVESGFESATAHRPARRWYRLTREARTR